MTRRALHIGLTATALIATGAHAQNAPRDPVQGPTVLDRVQVTATRTPRRLDRTPAAITVVDAAEADTAGVALSEMLVGVPGLLARNRNNLAQDEQVSIRGFGTRAAFGIRSVRVFVDGLPATLPDGQGQVSNVPLAGLSRIEVLRGPFAALYGNGAGGVVQLFTPDGGEPGHVGAELAVSSFDTRRLSTSSAGAWAGWDYASSSTILRTDGFREHSRARRDGLHAKAARSVGDGRLTLVFNGLDSPDVQDPQGLTAAQLRVDPRQASPAALAFDTRKSTRHLQLGAIYEREAEAGALRLLVHGGERRVEQVLGTPVAAQRNPLSAGGWVDLRSPLAGLDARWSMRASDTLEWVAGLSLEAQRQHRRGYENFVGTRLGVRGALRQRQADDVRTVDPYVQAQWQPSARWSLAAGLRHSDVRFRSRDRFVAAGNPNDSGEVRYRGLSPALGATFRASDALTLHAAVGHGFETPTFNELAYRTDGLGGPNLLLRPMRTRSAELGLRWARGALQGEATAFHAATRDELAVNTSSGGRTSFQNVGDARRLGVEAALRIDIAPRWQARVSMTWLDATYRDAFPACRGSVCSGTPAAVPAGTRIPGVPRTQSHALLRHGGDVGWHAQIDAQHVGGATVNAAGSERAAGYAVFGASAGYGWRGARSEGRAWLGVANLADRAYAGSVIVNESNARYYEPGAGRAITAGMEWRWRGD